MFRPLRQVLVFTVTFIYFYRTIESRPIKKSNMFRLETQKSHNFDDLTAIQFGWDFTVSQLGASEKISSVSLYQTPNVGYNRFWYGSAYDQRLHSRGGILSFGLLEPDNPATWAL